MSKNAKTKRRAARRGTPRKQARVKAEEATAKTDPKLSPGQRRCRAMRLHKQQAVFELHCRQGYSLPEVGMMLGVSTSAAYHHWAELKRMLAKEAPRTPEEMIALREEIAARLWATVEQTHGRTEVVGDDGEVTTVEAAPTPQMLAVRLRALEQIAKLYGVCGEGPGMAREGGTPAPPLFMTPEAVVPEVRRRQLEFFRRCEGDSAGSRRGASGGHGATAPTGA